MSRQFVRTFPGGELKQEVTSLTLVNATTKNLNISVPAGKQWILISIRMVNADDVNRLCWVTLYKEVAKTNVLLDNLLNSTLGATAAQIWPNQQTTTTVVNVANLPMLLVLKAANTLSFTWASGGASTGATDADGLVVTYLELDE